MKKLESSLTNMVVVLVVVAVVMGALLAMVNQITMKPIAMQNELALTNGIKQVMGLPVVKVTGDKTITKTFDNKNYQFVVHQVSDAYDKAVGVAVESTTLGFGGDLKVLVGFDNDGKILGYTVLEHAETPGLGAKADKWFQKGGKGNIIGKSISSKEPLTVSKDGGNIDAITASTITSRAFLKAINQAYLAYMGDAVDGASGASKHVEN